MDTSERWDEAVNHLREALDVEDCDEKDFHVRQALQLLDAEESLS